MKPKLFTLFLVLVASVGTIFAERVQIGDLYYNLDATNRTAEVTYQGYYSRNNYSGLTSANIPSSVTYNNQTYSVTSIGEGAFYACSSLTSVTIPNSVTSIGGGAFYGCSRLTSPVYNELVFARMPESYSGDYSIQEGIESIAGGAFSYCHSLTSVTIPNSVTSIGGSAFSYCSSLTSVTIPNSVTSIGTWAFSYCSSLTSVICEGSTPATLVSDAFDDTTSAFDNTSSSLKIIVPCGTIDAYKNEWSNYSSRIYYVAAIAKAVSADSNAGSVSVPKTACDSAMTATANYGYHFTQWSDGNTDNPRTIDPMEDVTYTAEFAFVKSGTCGDNNQLTWVFDAESKTLAISGNGTLNSNYTYGAEAPSQAEQLIIGEGVTSIGDYAFENCSSLTSVTIPNSVTSIGDDAFCGCSSLTSVTIGNSVTSIGEGAFRSCSSLTSVTIPNSVTSIGEAAFRSCSSLASVTMQSETPPALGNSVFGYGVSIYVPCGSLDVYRSADGWSNYASNIGHAPSPYTITTKAENGYIWYSKADEWSEGLSICDETLTLTAGPDRGCYFVKWADGNTDNPRTIELTQDITVEAIFDYLPTGKCGKDEALTWTFDAQTKALEITGAGELTENYTYTYNAEAVTIGNEITIIGEDAFYNCYQIKNIIIGSSVKVIEHNAYSSCYEFASITCYSQRPPTVKEGAFYYNLPYSTIIYVPADYLATYKAHDFWGMYDVRPLGAVTVETSDVKVTPTETTADVVWPAVDNAATYELVIKDKNGNVICTLIFNANGQLTQIAFAAPARDHSTQASGFSFTVTGLEAGTDYDLTIKAKDANGAVIETTTQSFTTADVPNAVENVDTGDTRLRKMLIDGQLFILRDGKTYTVQGQEVR